MDFLNDPLMLTKDTLNRKREREEVISVGYITLL